MRIETAAGEIYKRLTSNFPAPQEGDLCVWWIPQVPGKPFEWRVDNEVQASLLLDALAAYDDFQFAQNVKGDYANVGGLWRFESGEWCDWCSPDGDDFDEHRRRSHQVEG